MFRTCFEVLESRQLLTTQVTPVAVKWTGPEFDATRNDVAVETLEIAHEGLSTAGGSAASMVFRQLASQTAAAGRLALGLAVAVAAAALFMERPADAAQVTIAFDGVISSQGSFIDDSGNFAPGDPISGFWTFDSATPDGDPAPSRGEYVQSGSPAFQIDIGPHTFTANTTTVQILDDHTLGIGTIDAYDVLSAPATSSIAGLVVNQMQLTLRDTAAPLDAVASDTLPLTAPDPASFDQQGQAAGQITGFFREGQLFMNLEITSTRVVPEPSGWALLGLGLASLVLARRKASHRRGNLAIRTLSRWERAG